jgi:serine protease Do
MEGMKVLTMVSGTFLGVGVREVDAERSKALKLKEEYGVEVTTVEPESPAAKAGLKVNDVVLEYNGQRVEGTAQFVRFVRETPSGRTVKLLVSRGGATQTVAATLATRKGKAFAYGMQGMPGMEGFKVEIPHMSMPDVPKAMMSWRSATLGVEAESLGDSQLATYFGVKEGVLVRSVLKGSAAEKAGIKAGDVLLKVGEDKVTSPRDVSGAMRSARSSAKKSIPVVLMRDKRETSLTVAFDEDKSDAAPTPRSQRVTVRQMDL